MNNFLPYRYFCIEGNIGSGKTTLTRMLAQEYNALMLLEQFAENPFLAAFYENKERYAFPVEVFFLIERHKQMQMELSVSNLFHETVIADYCFQKTVLFARENLDEREYSLFYKLFHQLNQQLIQPELVVYLHRPVEALLRNIRKRNRSFEQNIEADYLASLSQAYLSYLQSQTEFPVIIIHLNDGDFENNPKLYRKIKNFIFGADQLHGIQQVTLTD